MNNLNFLRRCYHAIIPSPLRLVVWHFIAALKAATPVARRRQLRELRCALHLPVTSVLVGGVTMRIDLRDEGIAQTMYDDRDYEPVETRFVTKNLNAGDTFIDIGANIGYFSVQAAAVVGLAGKVVAIEPDPYNFGLLQYNLRRNSAVPQVIPLNMALGNERGVATLFRNSSNFGDHRMYDAGGGARAASEVAVEAFDTVVADLALQKVDFIKMDVQGFECHVLRGMKKTLAELRPIVITEFWPFGLERANTSAEEVLRCFADADYTVHGLDDTGLSRLDYGAVMSKVPLLNPLQPDASYLNLVFLPAGAVAN